VHAHRVPFRRQDLRLAVRDQEHVALQLAEDLRHLALHLLARHQAPDLLEVVELCLLGQVALALRPRRQVVALVASTRAPDQRQIRTTRRSLAVRRASAGIATDNCGRRRIRLYVCTRSRRTQLAVACRLDGVGVLAPLLVSLVPLSSRIAVTRRVSIAFCTADSATPRHLA